MTDFTSDDSRLRATEAQMRRALGLQDGTAPRAASPAPGPMPGGHHRPGRRFVRDGEVPVSVIHRDEGSDNNPLEAARQALRSQTQAREQAERLLAEAQATIRDLQTKLGHEQLAREEARQRASAAAEAGERSLASLQAELEASRAARLDAEEQLAAALERCQAAEQDRQTVLALPEPLHSSDDQPEAAQKPSPARRRGGARKMPPQEPGSDFVEWWKPGWRDRYR